MTTISSLDSFLLLGRGAQVDESLAALTADGIQRSYRRGRPIFAAQRDSARDEDLRDREQRLRQAIEQIPRPVIFFDLKGRVIDANPALATWISAPVETTLGLPVWKLPGGPRRAEDVHWARTLLSQSKPWMRQYETRLPLGGVWQRRLVNATVTPLLGAHGRVAGYVAVAEDVTEKARLEKLAATSNLNDTLGMVFASLRHELGNPINSLKAALDVIGGGGLAPEQLGRYHLLMQQQLERMEFLLGHMRSFGQFDRLEMRELELEPELVTVDSLLESVMEKQRARLAWNVPPGLKVWADSRALAQVLVALLDNAAKAVAEQPSERRILWVEARAAQGQVTIEVRDQGCGFASGDREKIFAPFHSNRPGGTGLGLAIARRVLTQMGGTICAQGEVGKGATFTLILDGRPRARA